MFLAVWVLSAWALVSGAWDQLGAWDLSIASRGWGLNPIRVARCGSQLVVPLKGSEGDGVGLWDTQRQKWVWRLSEPQWGQVEFLEAQDDVAWVAFNRAWVALDCVKKQILWEREISTAVWGLPARVKGRLIWVTVAGAVWALEALTGQTLWIQPGQSSGFFVASNLNRPLLAKNQSAVWILLPHAHLVKLDVVQGRELARVVLPTEAKTSVAILGWGPWYWDGEILWLYDPVSQRVVWVHGESHRIVAQQGQVGRWSGPPERLGDQWCVWRIPEGLWCIERTQEPLLKGFWVKPFDSGDYRGPWQFQVIRLPGARWGCC